jgi:hypothetical protein
MLEVYLYESPESSNTVKKSKPRVSTEALLWNYGKYKRKLYTSLIQWLRENIPQKCFPNHAREEISVFSVLHRVVILGGILTLLLSLFRD